MVVLTSPCNLCIWAEIRKNNVYPCKLQFYYIKVGFQGSQNYIGMFSWCIPFVWVQHFWGLPLTHCSRETRKRITGKHCRTRSDTAECGVWSGSPLFATSISHFSLGLCNSYSRTYLKLKLDSSNIYCGRIYSVYSGLNCFIFRTIL